ncbi:MAG: CBS domain-containing protein [Bacteroidetes bacterium]|nr:CBS domain-containing protein [Bacteroidota bacterium]
MATIRDLLKTKGDQVWTVTPNTSVLETLLMMTEKAVGALVVVEGDQIAGIISERDFIHSIAEKERCVLNTVVLEYMTTTVLTVSPDQSIEDCMLLMTDKHIRHLPVVENGKLVGMISIGDIVKDIISSEKSRINALENYIEGRGYGQ